MVEKKAPSITNVFAAKGLLRTVPLIVQKHSVKLYTCLLRHAT